MSGAFQFNGFNEASYWNGQYGAVPWLKSLQAAKADGANTIAITSTSFLSNKYSSSIYSTQQTESLANVAKAVADAKANGLTAILKPHIDLIDGNWRGRLDPANEADFFKNYKAWILDYAKVAQAQGADMLVIGTELDQLAGSEYHAQWADIVSSIRSVYSGKLTYAANADANTGIWDLVDYIGVNPYLPLSTDKNATKADFVKAWNSVPSDPFYAKLFNNMTPVEYYKKLSETYKKPMIMTELGYRSLDGTAGKPMDFSSGGTVDQKEQAALFDALFEVFSAQSSWMKGTLIWGWSTDRAALETKSNWASGYSIEGKLAEDIVKKWYGSGTVIQKAGTQTVELTLKLAADVAGGPAIAAVIVDRQLVGTIEVGNATSYKGDNFKDYKLSVPMVKNADGTAHTVEVYFLNPSGGRALHVDAITLGGVRYEAEAAGSTKAFTTAYSSTTITKFSVSDSFMPTIKPPVLSVPEVSTPTVPAPVPVEPVKITGTDGRDNLTATEAGATILARGGDDTISVSKAPTLIDGGAGNDRLVVNGSVTFAADSVVNVERASITGSHAVDFSALKTGLDIILDKSGATVTGTQGSDSITTTGGSIVKAGGGDDKIMVRGTGDTIFAGDGNDHIMLYSPAAKVDGGAGNDLVTLWGQHTITEANFTNIERFAVADEARVDFSGMTSDLSIIGSGIATKGKIIIGGSGNDTIRLMGGDDKLYGGAGNDTIYGDSGNDYIAGGKGADQIWGGTGRDTFVFGVHDADGARDTVNDFVRGEDNLRFEGFTANQLHHTSTAQGVLITADAGAAGHLEVLVKGATWAQVEGSILFA
ncbi:glycoside hydrolase family 113 [Aureimonas psammosilenae]|uniref:glycoside hydrolase family 113 n=1 Tax=Aureimonas psammosilenae TaxID=2495496 RepID=UPI001260AA6D|nr:carbohydrate-binding domain-containing protein [Aureimonas psammosilenae]